MTTVELENALQRLADFANIFENAAHQTEMSISEGWQASDVFLRVIRNCANDVLRHIDDSVDDLPLRQLALYVDVLEKSTSHDRSCLIRMPLLRLFACLIRSGLANITTPEHAPMITNSEQCNEQQAWLSELESIADALALIADKAKLADEPECLLTREGLAFASHCASKIQHFALNCVERTFVSVVADHMRSILASDEGAQTFRLPIQMIFMWSEHFSQACRSPGT